MSVLELPRRVASAVTPSNAVDDWGRDPHFMDLLGPVLTTRWSVSVGGVHHLPSRAGALLVTNERRWSSSPLYVAWSLSRASGRPVRFVGRPDHAPLGALLRRMGALLADPVEVRGALAHGELVVIGAATTAHPRHAGAVDAALIGAAVATGAAVHPVASMSTPYGRAARAEVGPAVRTRRRRRGPLAEVELADAAQRSLQTMLDQLGGVQLGVPAIDWVGEG